MATVSGTGHFDAKQDANELEAAMKGLGTDEKMIIEILSRRTVNQRKQIAIAYKAAFGKDLKDRLHSELSGHFRRAVLYSFYNQAQVNAAACYRAIKGAGTDEKILIDVICSADNAEIASLKKAYTEILNEKKQNTVRRNLEADVKGDVSGDFERVLVALLQGKRETSVNNAQVTQDVQDFYNSGEKKLGTDESVFTRILVTRSYEAIRSINNVYTQEFGHDLMKAIEKETSGDYRRALITIVKTALNKTELLADILYESMEGMGTHDDNLIRMIMAYSETSLATIRNTFNAKYTKETLNDMVKGDTSGDYRSFLLAILGEY